MKKLFKKGLIALTLMLGMTFAAPQTASAKYLGSKTYKSEVVKSYTIVSFYDDHLIVYNFDGDGNLIESQWVWNHCGVVRYL